MTDPPIRSVSWPGAHRLIPSRFSESGTVLSSIADSDEDLQALVLLDGATNDRIQGEQTGLPGISTFELIYGIPNAHIVNAAYTHPNESGSRFNDGTRGAWYAADRQEASLSEVAYHKGRRLANIIVPGEPDGRPVRDTSTYDDWLADFAADFHTLHPPHTFSRYLQPEPVPECYGPSQALARHLLNHGSNGLIYPSVRHRDAQCIVCFRPALVYNPRQSDRLELTLTASPRGYDYTVRPVPPPLRSRKARAH